MANEFEGVVEVDSRDSAPGWGLYVGRDSASPVSADFPSPFPFTDGTIDRMVVDGADDNDVDHEQEVLAHLARD